MAEENQEPEVVQEVPPAKDEKYDGYSLVAYEVEMSPEVDKLAEALSIAQGAMTNGKKDSSAHNYKYMTLDQVTDICRKPFADNGLSIIQPPALGGRAMPTVVVTTILLHSSGQWIKSKTEVPLNVGAKGVNLAQLVGMSTTYGRRYALSCFCNIASEEDNDCQTK